MATLLFLLALPMAAATPADLHRLRGFTHDSGAGYSLDAPTNRRQAGWSSLLTPQGGWVAMGGELPMGGALLINRAPPMGGALPMGGYEMLTGGAAPAGGSFQMSGSTLTGETSLRGQPSQTEGAPKFDGMSKMGGAAPVGVAADYSHFAQQLGGGQHNNPDLIGLYSASPSYAQHVMGASPSSEGPQSGKDLHYQPLPQGAGLSSIHQSTKTGPMSFNEEVPGKNGLNTPTSQPPGLKSIPSLEKVGHLQQHQDQKIPHPPPLFSPPLPSNGGRPSHEQLLMSNLFVMGLDKGGDHKQLVPEPLVGASGSRGLGVIPELAASELITTKAPMSTATGTGLRAPCDSLVDAVFALDDMENLWLARESIRYYETQLLPSSKARFGVVLCGQQKSFYTALHSHFSGLLASLEDLQHANATLDPTDHMPDTLGYRSDNNPYPPRVSEDFAQSDAGCLETAYHLFSFQNPERVDRLLVVMGTKERWGDRVSVEEARFLHSLNISLLSLADNALSQHAQDSLRKMASSPDKFRFVSDNVTLHALPSMIGSAICRPQKADVTVPVQRTSLGKIQEPVVTNCRQINSTSLERTQDFGRFFGLHTDHVRCVAGLVPDPQLCACV